MHDVVIRGGRVIDGTGSPWFMADVAISGDRIQAMGTLARGSGHREIDARGAIVAPGLIDIHTHSDLTLVIDPRAASTLAQGVTSQIMGNCGVSAAPTRNRELYYGPLDPALTSGIDCDWLGFRDYFRRLESTGIATNVASFVGHGNIRAAAMGYEDRAPSEDELERMRGLTVEAMEDGAIGMTTGLAYIPGTYAKPAEVLDLARVVARYGGIYASHIRNQTESIAKSVRECIEIGKGAGITAHVSHMQPGAPRLGCAHELLDMIEGERGRGVDVSCDAIPYTIGSTTLKSLLPPWANDGGDAALLQRLKNPAERARIKADTMTHGAESGGSRKRTLIKDGRWDKLWLASAEKNLDLVGKDFAEIARMRRQDPHEALLDILIEEEAKPWMLAEDVAEADFLDIARHQVGGVISDGFSLHPEGVLGQGRHHPRSYGAFPYFLRRFVREDKRLTWEAAIHKLTGYAASRFHLAGRGVLQPGNCADVVVFDPERIAEQASFADPYRFATGIHLVLVNGEVALEAGAQTDSRPGRVLRRGARDH
ncbi:MAG: D-aminoacylase [Proteobacteria bacterium]|nr:D-aminoacylase [Pseudomonadota bacterium]MBI3505653.1 D-aminoacylase [Pseudomonadota bacterium]